MLLNVLVGDFAITIITRNSNETINVVMGPTIRIRSSMFYRSKSKVVCESSITKRCLSLFDVQKLMFELVKRSQSASLSSLFSSSFSSFPYHFNFQGSSTWYVPVRASRPL